MIAVYRVNPFACLLAKNHPFNDGNKRTALLSTRASLYLNGQVLEPVQQDEVAAMLAVADGSLDEQQLAVWLMDWTDEARKD